MRKNSLSRQLIVGVLLAEFLCAALFSWIAIEHEIHGRRRAFDVVLRGRADSVLGAVRDAEDPEDNAIVDPTELVLPKHDLYEVVSPSGRVLGQSPGPALLAALGSAPTADYFDFRVNAERYRGYRLNGMRVIDRDDNGGIRRPVTVFYAAPTRNIWNETLEAVRFYLVTSTLLLAGTGVALIWFLRRRLSPLQELAAIAGRVSTRSWEFVPPNIVLQTSELAPIAHSIEELLAGLRESFERQRQLTGDAAHELKTSIAVLKSSLQLLSMNPRTTEQYESGLENLLVDTERMEDLASRMLALARLEEAPAESSESSDLYVSVRNVAERLRPLANLKKISLDVRGIGTAKIPIPTEDAEVLCSNLMMNAMQHSSADQYIVATIDLHDGVTELRVKDQGDGIPETALPHVFDRFYRADRSRSRNSGGAGLGLSICKAIVERSGGTIHIQSAPGLGTEVTATWPVAQADHVPSELGSSTAH
jgi:signal transduction histidine kinase